MSGLEEDDGDMAIGKELETKTGKKPILLKGTGQSLCLEVTIGTLGVELWDFPNEEAQPYARLIFDRDVGEGKEGILNWQECYALSGAIQDWLAFLESGIEEHREPALHMELDSVTFDFYRKGVRDGPKMVCNFESETGSSRLVVLTRSEASLLGRLLFCQGDDEGRMEY